MNSQRIYKSFIALMLLCFATGTKAQWQLNNVPKAFDSIPAKPVSFSFKSKIKLPTGGHLQGIVGSENQYRHHFLITGSSDSYSYYIKAESQGQGEDIEIIKIADSPFRHAGGCQYNLSWLFVGVEDNVAKNHSKVLRLPLYPTTVIDVVATRNNTYKRSTAGAVGATSIHDFYTGRLRQLVAVGDWDTRNIDFYFGDQYDGFDSVGTCVVPDNGNSCSYQSINLLQDTANHIYMIGMGKQGRLSRADLYLVENYTLSLVSTRLFKTTHGCSFRYAAGIRLFDSNKLWIYTSQRKLKKNNKVNVFGLEAEKHVY